MAAFTKEAIKASFLKILNEKPINKISVRDIAEDCGINRNSFYYHYHDIPALVEEIITEGCDALVARYPSIDALDDCVSEVMETAMEKRRVVFHIYQSVNRDVFEQYLMRFCEYAVETYLKTAFRGQEVGAEEHRLIMDTVKCTLFGLSIDWLMNGMKPEGKESLLQLLTLCRGIFGELLKK